MSQVYIGDSASVVAYSGVWAVSRDRDTNNTVHVANSTVNSKATLIFTGMYSSFLVPGINRFNPYLQASPLGSMASPLTHNHRIPSTEATPQPVQMAILHSTYCYIRLRLCLMANTTWASMPTIWLLITFLSNSSTFTSSVLRATVTYATICD